MTPRLRKFALTAHVVSSVGLLGAIASFLALAIAGVTSQNAQMVRAAYLAMELIAWFLIVPSAFASLLTGLIQSLGTTWGLFRHYWVLAKPLLTVFATIVLLVKMKLIGYAAGVAAETTLSGADLHLRESNSWSTPPAVCWCCWCPPCCRCTSRGAGPRTECGKSASSVRCCSPMNSLELKIPPPAVALLFGVLMWLVSSLVAPLEVLSGPRVSVALVLASVGLVVGVSGMVSFWRARTTMNPIKPMATSSLVTSGAFRFTRNPMYLSLLLYLLAWAVYLSDVWALLFVPMFVLYINEFQIKPEERALSSLFGPEYAAYKERVRRWL